METEMIQCPIKGCGHSPFPMSRAFVQRARRTHETFHCPAGHAQYFAGKSNEEKLRDELKIAKSELAIAKSRIRDQEWKIKRLRRMTRRCPWIGCDFEANPTTDLDLRPMWSHLRAAHGMPTKAEVEAEIDEVEG